VKIWFRNLLRLLLLLILKRLTRVLCDDKHRPPKQLDELATNPILL
jgi:hypothetical protein